MTLLELQSLTSIIYGDDNRETTAVDSVSLSVNAGETVCVVGESGSGKSMMALSIMRLIELEAAAGHRGKVNFKGVNLLGKSQREMRMVRGQQIAMVFQEPMTALNPVINIGKQLLQVDKYHPKKKHPGIQRKGKSNSRLVKALVDVGIADPETVLHRYPHQLSGGMRQRVMIAMALLGSPDLLIADEPTTALDVTTQAQILELLSKLQAERGMAILLITHDMAVASQVAHRIAVMYAGVIIEEAQTQQILKSPKHPYTKGLMAAVPSMTTVPRSRLTSIRGSVPSLDQTFSGCRFSPRCEHASGVCFEVAPSLTDTDIGTKVACWKAEELLADL